MDQAAYDVFKQKTNPRKDNMMTNSSLIALLQAQRGMTTCKVSVNSKSYTYKIPPGMIVAKDDQVVAPFGEDDRLRVVKVTSVDDVADIDVEAGINYKWVVNVVDMTRHMDLVAEEKTIAKKMAMAEAQSRLLAVTKAAGIDLEKIDTPALSHHAV